MDSKEIAKVTADIKKNYPDIGLSKIEYDGTKASFFINPNPQKLAGLETKDAIKMRTVERAATIKRDFIQRTSLDLSQGYRPVMDESPQELFRRAYTYYYEQDIYGTSIDALTNFASKGFENDCSDVDIKHFYDVWNFDVKFHKTIQSVFFDFFRIGMVRTYKVVGKYEPGITFISPVPGQGVEKGILKQITERANRINKRREELADEDEKKNGKESAQKKRKWSKGYIPIGYTVLNPMNIEVEGNLLFDSTRITMQPSDELKKMLAKTGSELSYEEKELIKNLPSDFKSAVAAGKIPLDSDYVGAIDYRKQPYERYPKPRGAKVFESIEYKKALRQADLSTLDGITNYILKITIGNDQFPVTEQSQLEAVAALFDTTSKSFDVVWNHTLEIEKIISPEIEAVLGKDKYEMVDIDIMGGLGMTRGMFDGSTQLNQAEAGLITKTIIEEINYAREQVEWWIYGEYREIAEAQGFDKFPRVRWDNTVLRDIILYMSTISQLVDRRMLSYRTAMEQLGFEYENEFSNMQEEFPEVMAGTLGIVGSPFQKSADGGGVQPTQKAPTGTPSSGRPKGKVAGPKGQGDPNKQTKTPNQSPSQQPNPNTKTASIDADVIAKVLHEAAKYMEMDQYTAFVSGFLSKFSEKD